MTTTTDPPAPPPDVRSVGGFTLAEVLTGLAADGVDLPPAPPPPAGPTGEVVFTLRFKNAAAAAAFFAGKGG